MIMIKIVVLYIFLCNMTIERGSNMKRYQARKAISVLLTLLMLMSSVYLGLGVIASAADPEEVADMTATALEAGKVYTVTRDTIIQGSSSSNGMTVAANTTVIIDIAEGVTLTVKGGNASGQNAGKAGILLGSNSKLIFTGKGNLVLTGGNGANGAKGVNANGSTGGAGGVGGGGGGAAIGGDGGKGGAAGGGNNGAGGSVSWPSNASVTVEGQTLTALISKRDVLTKRIRITRRFLNSASQTGMRSRGSEIILKSTVPVRELQKNLDELSKSLRETDTAIQAANWSNDLL